MIESSVLLARVDFSRLQSALLYSAIIQVKDTDDWRLTDLLTHWPLESDVLHYLTFDISVCFVYSPIAYESEDQQYKPNGIFCP